MRVTPEYVSRNYHLSIVGVCSLQVMVCPNPDSCTYTSRQQQLQQLQVDVRNIYYALQFQISVGSSYQYSPLNASTIIACAIVSSFNDSDKGAAFVDVLFFAINANLSTYASAQCAAGYAGRLCAICAKGYGSHGIAICKPCSKLNTLYYALALLPTLAFLAWTFYSSLSYARNTDLQPESVLRDPKQQGLDSEHELAIASDSSKFSACLESFAPAFQPTQGPQTGHANCSPGILHKRRLASRSSSNVSRESESSTQPPAWQLSIACSPASLASMHPAVQWETLPTPFAISRSTATAAHTFPAPTSATAYQLRSGAAPIVTISLSLDTEAREGAPHASKPAPYILGQQSSCTQGSVAASHTPPPALPPLSPPTPPAASPLPPHMLTTSDPQLGSVSLLPSSPPLSTSPIGHPATCSYLEELPSPSGRDIAILRLAATAENAHRLPLLAFSSSSCPSASTRFDSSMVQQSLVLQNSLESDLDGWLMESKPPNQLTVEAWLDCDDSFTAPAHISKHPQLGTQSDEDSYMELETRTSYFADTRDPVMVDSNRAAMVVTRIFLSYLQVRFWRP